MDTALPISARPTLVPASPHSPRLLRDPLWLGALVATLGLHAVLFWFPSGAQAPKPATTEVRLQWLAPAPTAAPAAATPVLATPASVAPAPARKPAKENAAPSPASTADANARLATAASTAAPRESALAQAESVGAQAENALAPVQNADAGSTPPTADARPPVFDADYLQNPQPDYPPLSRRLREHGEVLLYVWVGEDGRAQEVRLENSSGHTRLDAAALAAVKTWRFEPARQGHTPVAAAVLVPVRFQLQRN